MDRKNPRMWRMHINSKAHPGRFKWVTQDCAGKCSHLWPLDPCRRYQQVGNIWQVYWQATQLQGTAAVKYSPDSTHKSGQDMLIQYCPTWLSSHKYISYDFSLLFKCHLTMYLLYCYDNHLMHNVVAHDNSLLKTTFVLLSQNTIVLLTEIGIGIIWC